MSLHIHNLILQGEHQQLDFKYAITDSKKIARTLVAFSNTNGGKLLIGVKDNGNISGVYSDEEYYMLEAAAQMYCKPEVAFKSRKWEINGKSVLEVTIPKGRDRPYKAPNEKGLWRAYVRINDQILLANSVILKMWQKLKSKRGVKVIYSQPERALLKYLQENDWITLSQYLRLAGISKSKAEHILANFIMLDIVELTLTETSARYSLKNMPDLGEVDTGLEK